MSQNFVKSMSEAMDFVRDGRIMVEDFLGPCRVIGLERMADRLQMAIDRINYGVEQAEQAVSAEVDYQLREAREMAGAAMKNALIVASKK